MTEQANREYFPLERNRPLERVRPLAVPGRRSGRCGAEQGPGGDPGKQGKREHGGWRPPPEVPGQGTGEIEADVERAAAATGNQESLDQLDGEGQREREENDPVPAPAFPLEQKPEGKKQRDVDDRIGEVQPGIETGRSLMRRFSLRQASKTVVCGRLKNAGTKSQIPKQ